ncbi:MAG: outer membrane beta-barrel protein [Rhizobiales bacterium]|nr:outer membrane beta-barrel protein [Hyphomicrobiales bacterium]
MKIKGILLASAAGVAFMPGAQAADLPAKAYPMAAPVAPSWAGFYIGLHAGGASQKGNIAFETTEYNTVSFVGGGQIGYNWQAGNFVFGLEADGSWLSKGKYLKVGNDSYGTHLSWLSTARGRFGAAFGNWHLYATAGAAFAKVKVSDCCIPSGMFSHSKTRVGWTVGGGAEHMLTRNWVVGAELLYVDFGQTNHPFGGKTLTATTNSAVVGRAKLNYKF